LINHFRVEQANVENLIELDSLEFPNQKRQKTKCSAEPSVGGDSSNVC